VEPDAEGNGVATISVEDFHRRRTDGESLPLLDVREPHEFGIVTIPGSTPFPLSELPARLHELDSTRTYTVHCHKSARGMQAGQLMRKAGFGRVQVLSGGVDAWAARIDTSLPRY
jgi:adenylyltransferase/sulfurtransferase